MATYSKEDFERIAAAIGRDVGDVIKHKQLFEWAADWYGLDCGLASGIMAAGLAGNSPIFTFDGDDGCCRHSPIMMQRSI